MHHYHGLPITPANAAATAITGGHAFVCFLHPDQLDIAVEFAQSFAVDNGAFIAWKSGKPITDWRPFYLWVEHVRYFPNFDWAVIPDIIDGNEEENDALLDEWPFPKHMGAPVWHMHESLERLDRLSREYPRVCIGSSGDYEVVGTLKWWNRIAEVMATVCDGPPDQMRPRCKLHGLRMLDPEIFTRLPLASADSTNIGRNIGIDKKWKAGGYQTKNKAMRAARMRELIESQQSAQYWDCTAHRYQPPIFQLGEAA
jgi:hypothetical protein